MSSDKPLASGTAVGSAKPQSPKVKPRTGGPTALLCPDGNTGDDLEPGVLEPIGTQPPGPTDDGKKDDGKKNDGNGGGKGDNDNRDRNGGGGGWNPTTYDSPRVPQFSLGGPWSTARLLAILDALPGGDKAVKKAVLKVAGPFPVAGLAWWSNDWHAPRCCPEPHLHQGVDLMAPLGTRVVAAATGTVTQKVNDPASSGLGVEITDAKGTEYFYAHLKGFASGIEVGVKVRVGDVLGYVGNTGNASGGAAHLHFEVQPGGRPVPPIPFLNRWLGIAKARATALVSNAGGGEIRTDVERWMDRLDSLLDKARNIEREDLLEDPEVQLIDPSAGRAGSGGSTTTYASVGVGPAGIASAALLAIAGGLFVVATVRRPRRRSKDAPAQTPDGDSETNADGETEANARGDDATADGIEDPANRAKRGGKGLMRWLFLLALLSAFATPVFRRTVSRFVKKSR